MVAQQPATISSRHLDKTKTSILGLSSAAGVPILPVAQKRVVVPGTVDFLGLSSSKVAAYQFVLKYKDCFEISIKNKHLLYLSTLWQDLGHRGSKWPWFYTVISVRCC